MKNIFSAFLLMLSATAFAQYGYRDGNRIGISAGISQTTLFTNNFVCEEYRSVGRGEKHPKDLYDMPDEVYEIFASILPYYYHTITRIEVFEKVNAEKLM